MTATAVPEGIVCIDPGRGLRERWLELPHGRAVRTVVAGSGAGPTVVFVAGAGAGASEWVAVQRLVAETCTTVAFDRPGTGGTGTLAGEEPTLEGQATLLGQLLDAVSPDAPVVLVAHSWGGPIVRVFADRAPDRIAGVLMIDTTRAEQLGSVAVVFLRSTLALVSLLSKAGRHGALINSFTHNVTGTLDEHDAAVVRRGLLGPNEDLGGLRGELPALAGTGRLLRTLERRGLPAGVPLVTMAGALVDRNQRKARKTMIAGHRGDAERAGARFVLAEASGHRVAQHQPDLVAQTALDVVAAARS